MGWRLPALAALIAMGLSACGTVQAPDVDAGAAELVTPGITIKAADGSFTLYPGEPFKALGFSKSDNNNLGNGSGCGTFSYEAVTNRYREALKCGGIPVRIYAAGHSDVTYGILLLNQLDPSIEAMGASYRIEVPRQALRAANRGIMNVLYASATS
ncbi:MAG TPA: hypothetical protein VGL73_16730, partial [Caulobacteraceae bacterium]